ncbi:MAG TPA: WecB/TagA/CpsF family glycosyltransferase [Candidatus Hydrogenedentes bacterium]|nr:WecB/TagA/CpsF family glycosyltransferase [Candidatus Hydrogenedentota bacterium]HIJ72475.1 WecB/TagA/CpsF family glycosyltransferase [Candidatus Hydrogenedentota bacterium]
MASSDKGKSAVSAQAETSPDGLGAPVARVELSGMTIHNVTREEVFALIEERIAKRQPGYIVTPNVNHLCRYQRDAEFREAYRKSFLVLADGVPLLWASRLLGTPLREKLSGSDLVVWLPERFADKGRSFFLLGAAEGVADAAAKELRRRHPNIVIAGTYSPPMGFENDPAEVAETARRVREARPDFCFVAFGVPKQELWMREHCQTCGVPVMLGIGASLDFLAGTLKRAPRWMQRVGLEWVWRIGSEPRRLLGRYLADGCVFLSLLWRAFRKRRACRPT